MKFVVNRVHSLSLNYGSSEGLEGIEVCVDDNTFYKSVICNGYCRGYIISGTSALFVGAFTVAEVPDTEEGYYLL